MNQYLISEDELIDYTSRVKNDMGKSLIGKLYKDFLKSKKPVEIIGKGEVTIDDEDGEVWIGDPDVNGTPIHNEMMSYEGKKGTLIFVPDKEE